MTRSNSIFPSFYFHFWTLLLPYRFHNAIDIMILKLSNLRDLCAMIGSQYFTQGTEFNKKRNRVPNVKGILEWWRTIFFTTWYSWNSEYQKKHKKKIWIKRQCRKKGHLRFDLILSIISFYMQRVCFFYQLYIDYIVFST